MHVTANSGSREQRLVKALSAKALTNDKGQKFVAIENAKIQFSMSNTEHIVQEMHDIVKSYYKVARKRVVDNIIMQVVDYHLISGPSSPLRVLSPFLISQMSDPELEQIAGEDELTKVERDELQKTIAELQKGKKILQSA
jgi:hypothetical protein